MQQNSNLATINLTHSQIIKDNPIADLIAELNQLKPSIIQELQHLTKKHEILMEELNDIKKQQKKYKAQQKQLLAKQLNAQQPPPAQPLQQPHIINQQTPLTLKNKQLHKSSTIIQQKQKLLQTLQLRLQLLNLSKSLGFISPSRLEQLQRIFNHYCNYIFKSGRHVTFDRIEYEKSHLIMERFFAFVHDFHINKYLDTTKGEKELVPKHQLILIFKKSSSNSRNLELTEFIASVERFAVLRYDYQESYEQRKQKEELERKRIKDINLRREKERERRKKEKEEYDERKRQEELKKAQEQEQRRKRQLQASQQQGQPAQGQQPNKEQSKQERKQRKKKEKEKKKKKKQVKGQNESQAPDLAKSQQSNNENNNDQMLNELMQKDSSIENPNEQFSHLKKFKKSSKANLLNGSSDHLNSQQMRLQQLMTLSQEQKVQLLYRLIELDNPKSVQLKLRQYEKPLFKQLASQRKSSIMLNSSSISKIKQTDHNHELKLNQLKTQLQHKKRQRQKANIERSITDEKYSIKKKQDYDRYLIKSIAINNNDLDAIEQRKSQNKKKTQSIQLSLNLLNHSSDAQLTSIKLTNNLRKYFHPQEDDTVYLKEYGGLEKIKSSNSSFIERTPRYSVDIKKRAHEVEELQKKNEEHKLERFALQMYKNQHYMKRFLERKF